MAEQPESVDGFVDAYAKSTGRKVRVPEHFLDHPVIGDGFRKTPPPKAAQADDSASTKTARNRGAAQTPAGRGEE